MKTAQKQKAEGKAGTLADVDLPADLKHLSDEDLERYHLGMVRDTELTTLEEHVIACGYCAKRAAEAAAYVDTMRAAIIKGNFDLESPSRRGFRAKRDQK